MLNKEIALGICNSISEWSMSVLGASVQNGSSVNWNVHSDLPSRQNNNMIMSCLKPCTHRCPAFKLLTYYGNTKERARKREGWSKPNAFHVCITSYTLVLSVSGSCVCCV